MKPLKTNPTSKRLLIAAVIIVLCAIITLSSVGCFSLLEDVVNDVRDVSEPPDTEKSDTETDGLEENQDISNNNPEETTEPDIDQQTENNNGDSQQEDIENSGWGSFPITFTANDVYGNTVTEESFGEKQIFFVHYWATWCGPCIHEMPEIAEIVSEYEDRVGFIALLDDYSSNARGAQNIYDSSNIPTSFITVDAGAPELRELLNMVQSGYVPTTILIDIYGNMLGEQIIGAYGLLYAEILDNFLE